MHVCVRAVTVMVTVMVMVGVVVRTEGKSRVPMRTMVVVLVGPQAVAVRHRPAFRSWVLGLLEHAEVLGPEELRADVVGWLEAVAGAPRG